MDDLLNDLSVEIVAKKIISIIKTLEKVKVFPCVLNDDFFDNNLKNYGWNKTKSN